MTLSDISLNIRLNLMCLALYLPRAAKINQLVSVLLYDIQLNIFEDETFEEVIMGFGKHWSKMFYKYIEYERNGSHHQSHLKLGIFGSDDCYCLVKGRFALPLHTKLLIVFEYKYFKFKDLKMSAEVWIKMSGQIA